MLLPNPNLVLQGRGNNEVNATKIEKHYQGKLEAANTKTRSSDLARPSIWTSSSVFILLLPSCSPLYNRNITVYSISSGRGQ